MSPVGKLLAQRDARRSAITPVGKLLAERLEHLEHELREKWMNEDRPLLIQEWENQLNEKD
jgi:hypothetical protein